MLRRWLNAVRDESGAVASVVAVALVGLLAVGAVAWDLSRGYALRAELDAAVDAAALAGASQLDGQANARTRATAAAQGALVTNMQNLANSREAAITVANADITYIQNLTGAMNAHPAATTDADANFIQINLSPRNLSLIFGAFARVSSLNVRAHAVAGYGAAICKSPPLMICNPDETSTNKLFNGDAYIGKAVALTPSGNGGGAWPPGNFGFIDVPVGVKEAMGSNAYDYDCIGDVAQTEPGNKTSADDYFNNRFDIYDSGAKNENDANYIPAMNTIVGLKTKDSDACKVKQNDLVSADSYGCANSTAVASGMGLPADCNQSGSTPVVGNGIWNAAKYFATNHSGINLGTYVPAAPGGGSGWTAFGPAPVSGATSPTRYQVYNWELAILSGAISKPSGVFSASQDATSGNNIDFAKPQCNKLGSQASPDRRAISAAIVNCNADDVRGNSTVNVISAVDLFLLAPIDKGKVMYGEVIGKSTETSAVGRLTRRYSVRLYE